MQNSYDDADDGDNVDEYIVIMIGGMFHTHTHSGSERLYTIIYVYVSTMLA